MTLDHPLLVLFDCDGTLVDGQHLIVAAMSAAFRAHNLPVPARSDILSVVGLSLPETFATLSGGDPDFPIEVLVEGYKDAFHQIRHSHPSEPMFEGMRDIVDAIRSDPRHVLGIVTGKSQRGVQRVLEEHAMQGWFANIQTADDAPSKPHPAMVQQAISALGGAPAFTIVVGDTTYDMEMAKAAGAWAIGVTWGYHERGDLLETGADLLVDAPSELLPAVRDLFRRAGLP